MGPLSSPATSSSEPAAPLPSSTVILLCEEHGADAPFSVLLLERHGSISFPGAHAFPGGVVDTPDADAPGCTLPSEQRWAEPGEGDRPPDALPYWVAAVRELFEEVGILLARRDGRVLDSPPDPSLNAVRTRSQAGEPFVALLAEHGLVPATDVLAYFARWITPIVNPRRFDTRFLVGRMPPGQSPIVDGTETVSCQWLTPRAALQAYEEGRLILIPPTVRTLDDLAHFPSIDAVLADARQRVVRAVTPEVVQKDGVTAICYPSGSERAPACRLVLQEGRWRRE